MPTTMPRRTPRCTDVPQLRLTTRSEAPTLRRASRAGLTAVGVAATAGVLAAAATAAAPTGATTPHPAVMSEGTSGPAVSAVQRALHVRVNGHFNRRTEHAVLAFQRHHDLQADGVIGPQTWDAVFHLGSGSVSATANRADGSVTPSTTSTDTGTGGYSIPAGIVQCESGGDYSAVNPGSGAGGAYQILPSTWAAYGGQGLPEDASPAEQSAIAAKIYANQGAGAWTC